MQKPIERYREKVEAPSNDALATMLLDRFPTLAWGTTNHRSIGAKLGQIDRGNTSWWQKRPELVNALAELLDVSPEDLGIHPHSSETLHRFPEFPELPPLDLTRERPCSLGRPISLRGNDNLDSWLSDKMLGLHLNPVGVDWLHFPTGRGVDLFWENLIRTSRYECRRSNTIGDSAGLLTSPRHLVLRIESDGGDKDIGALASMHPESALLVIAPHSFSYLNDSDNIGSLYSWERNTASIEARHEIDFLMDPFSKLTKFEWVLHDDWIYRLLNWIEKRINSPESDTMFTAKRVLRAVHESPYLQSQLQGPGDVFHLSSLFHKIPQSKLSGFDERSVGVRLLKQLTSPVIQESYRELAIATWENDSHNWGSAQTINEWIALGTTPTVESLKGIEEIAEEEDLLKRRKLAKRFRNPKSITDISGLLQKELLVHNSGEGLTLRPRFLPGLLARDHVIDCITKKNSQSWALHCYDAKRRQVIDAALDTLSDDQLLAIATKIPASIVGNAEAIATAEAIFYSIGRRITTSKDLPAGLQRISSAVLNNLIFYHEYGIPGPWSRPITDRSSLMNWLATCWAWSLTPQPEGISSDIQDSWLLPGWASDLDNAAFKEAVDKVLPDEKYASASNSQPLLQRAQDLVDSLKEPIVNSPVMLKPFLIAAAAKNRWSFFQEWWDQTRSAKWAEDILVKSIDELSPILLPNLLISFSRTFIENKKNDKYSISYLLISKIRISILKRLPAESIESLPDDIYQIFLSFPESLPLPLRRKLLKDLCLYPIDIQFYSKKLIHLGTADDLSILVDLLETKHWRTAGLQIWKLTPHQAESIINGQSMGSDNVLRGLLMTCPDPKISAPLISKFRSVFEKSELENWVREHLPNAGLKSQEILNVLSSE